MSRVAVLGTPYDAQYSQGFELAEYCVVVIEMSHMAILGCKVVPGPVSSRESCGWPC